MVKAKGTYKDKIGKNHKRIQSRRITTNKAESYNISSFLIFFWIQIDSTRSPKTLPTGLSDSWPRGDAPRGRHENNINFLG